MRHLDNRINMKYPIIILLFFYSTIKSQTFGGIYTSGYYATKDVQKEMDKAISKGQRKKEISSYNKTINDDTLSYIIQHNADPFVMKNFATFKNIFSTALPALKNI